MSSETTRFDRLRNAFISGLLMLAPLFVTLWVFSTLLETIGGSVREFVFPYIPEAVRNFPGFDLLWNLFATVLLIVLVTLIGYVSRYLLGRYFGGLAERFIHSIPGVSGLYKTVKQIVDTFGSQNRNLFNKVVLVQFPRAGCYAIGFLTNKNSGEAQAKLPAAPLTSTPPTSSTSTPAQSTELWTVFIPTSPNPTSGFLVLLPRDEITVLDMSVGDGMKMIISGGAVIPPWPPTSPAHPFTAASSAPHPSSH